MKIYHYTSLDNLALILKNKTIRLNRLDRMDDPCECNFFSYGMHCSPYTYVSCWTESDEESIPLWNMYAKGGNGVRIGIEQDCIDWEKCDPSYFIPQEQVELPPEDEKSSSLSMEILPFSIYGEVGLGNCFHRMKYNDRNKIDKEIIIGGNSSKIMKQLTGDNFYKYIALYKDAVWAFQKEARFRLFGVPRISEHEIMPYAEFEQIVKNKTYNPINYIDLDLKESVFETMDITLGPNSTLSTFIIVEAITKIYAPKAIISGSILNSKTWEFHSIH